MPYNHKLNESNLDDFPDISKVKGAEDLKQYERDLFVKKQQKPKDGKMDKFL